MSIEHTSPRRQKRKLKPSFYCNLGNVTVTLNYNRSVCIIQYVCIILFEEITNYRIVGRWSTWFQKLLLQDFVVVDEE